MTKILIKELF